MILLKRYKLITLTLALATSSTSCNDQLGNDQQMSVDEKITCLEEYIPRKELSADDKQRLFECFPSSPEEFQRIFDQEEERPHLAGDHVIVGNHLPKVKPVVGIERYAKKLISVSAGLRGFADSPNYLRAIFRSEFSGKDAIVFFKELDKLDKSRIAGFWNFYFRTWDGIQLSPEVCKERKDSKACDVLTSMIEDQNQQAQD